MRNLALVALVAAGLSLPAAASVAQADETTTTTTTRTDAPSAPGVTVGVPGVVGVHIGGDARPEGCATRKTTHTNDETGDTVTHKETNCD